jgi:hypothetical protein
MAIYHLTAKTVSRSSGASAKARSEYIDREGKYKKGAEEVQHKESGNMPEWAKETPTKYWQAADENERANGRLFKQLEFSLPKELDAKEQAELAASFCREIAQTKDGPLPYSFAVHKGREGENPHCHLLISERVNDGHARSPETWFKRAAKEPDRGGAKKTEELKPKEWLTATREKWAERANLVLDRAGHTARIDHRTLQAQGIDREPTTHMGPAAAAMERKGMATDRGVEHRQSRSQGKPEQDTAQKLQDARKTLESISTGIDKARSNFVAWQAREAEKKRQQELVREKQEAERKVQERERCQHRDRGGPSL